MLVEGERSLEKILCGCAIVVRYVLCGMYVYRAVGLQHKNSFKIILSRKTENHVMNKDEDAKINETHLHYHRIDLDIGDKFDRHSKGAKR
jgi:hypothetical protein